MRYASSLLIGLLLAAPVSAQVTMTGTVRPLPGPTVCQQGETHTLECTGVLLRSSLIDLRRWEGRTVTLTADEVGVTCKVYEVTGIADARVTLDWSGIPTPGGRIRFQVCVQGSNPPHLFKVYGGLERGFIYLGPLTGTRFLGADARLVATGWSLGCGSAEGTIPNRPSLVGRWIYCQAVGIHLWAELSNPVCFLVQ